MGVCYWLARLLRMERSTKFMTLTRKRSKKSFKDTEAQGNCLRVKQFTNAVDCSSDGLLLRHSSNDRHVWTTSDPGVRQGVTRRQPPPATSVFYVENHQAPSKERRLQGSDCSPGEVSRCALLGEILAELRRINAKLEKDEEAKESCNDWKFAAMVIDRLCLFVFTTFTVVSTFAILFSAPHFSFNWTSVLFDNRNNFIKLNNSFRASLWRTGLQLGVREIADLWAQCFIQAC